jgi:hypothetical protein
LDEKEFKNLKNEVENLKKRVHLLETLRISRLKKLLEEPGGTEEQNKNLQKQIDLIEALQRS